MRSWSYCIQTWAVNIIRFLINVRISLALRLILFASVFVLFIYAECSVYPVVDKPVHSGDAGVWPYDATFSLLETEFYTAHRPFTVPLVYKLANSEEGMIVVFQSVLSIICWYSLGLILANCFRSVWLQLLSVIVICGFALCIPVNQWDYVIRSESICFSMFALTLAMSLYQMRRLMQGQPLAISAILWWAVICLLFISTRDSVTYIMLILLVALVIWFIGLLVIYFLQRRASPICGTLLLSITLLGMIVYFGYWSTLRSKRWLTMVHVVLNRVLPQPEVYQLWQTKYGFPTDSKFETYAGKYLWDPADDGISIGLHLFRDKDLIHVWSWFKEHGPSSYQRYLLLDNFMGSILDMQRAFTNNVNKHNRQYAEWTAETNVTRLLTRTLYPDIPCPTLLWGIGIVTAIYVAIRIMRLRLAGCFAGFLLINTVGQAFVCYHGDTAEVPRHIIMATISFRLGLIVLILIFISLLVPALFHRLLAYLQSDSSDLLTPPLDKDDIELTQLD